MAGLAAAMAGVGGGYSANLIIVGMDVILAGLSTSAAQIVDKNLVVSPVDNWFFMVCSVVLLTAITTIITDTISNKNEKYYEENSNVETSNFYACYR
ncbi:p-aminobenzoyl-glutamate transport protein [Sporomusa acidovorans DSM 3132]|uniref:p-aminobenzoyl-glutamate transport protein n=1 Tax=Sporomusa acidovorans (strain ATCC 49682 / DSM 3132 / Mol) TaxID=1123286 RepID=A0ABZ3J1C2_SPOA4|nr:p-aminobenzoyl-glutamate transport protein [Sporomusa acidovorans DSM 3132]SDF37271.1 AbgT putative transporter family protein [Sporomusa acidovorans]